MVFAKALLSVVRLAVSKSKTSRILFYGTSGRHLVTQDTVFDLYNARIVESCGRDRVIIFQDADDGITKQYPPDFCFHGLAVLIGVCSGINCIVMFPALSRYAQALAQTYPGLGFDQAQIRRRVALFYGKFTVYRLLLSIWRPERVLLIAHYGKEAFIAACKCKHIPVTELMHGSIIPSHTQYVFPKFCGAYFDRALFPDKLAVYGEYWRDVVVHGNMFPQDSVVVLGYYLKVPDIIKRRHHPGKTVVVVSTQPIVQRELYEYLLFLKSCLDRAHWHIIVKPHPREDSRAYADLAEPGFVTVSDVNVYDLLAQADVHISVYSSVLYEAVRFSVCNYVLYIEKVSMYCDDIINSGVALALTPRQLPLPRKGAEHNVEYYFAEFNPSVLLS
ncbi:MAG: hypothetical protein ACYTEQ_05085 [Planctomycetota bacterium]|jgi:hypothetical protein